MSWLNWGLLFSTVPSACVVTDGEDGHATHADLGSSYDVSGKLLSFLDKFYETTGQEIGEKKGTAKRGKTKLASPGSPGVAARPQGTRGKGAGPGCARWSLGCGSHCLVDRLCCFRCFRCLACAPLLPGLVCNR